MQVNLSMFQENLEKHLQICNITNNYIFRKYKTLYKKIYK